MSLVKNLSSHSFDLGSKRSFLAENTLLDLINREGYFDNTAEGKRNSLDA